jgi:hypothetical protein
MLTLRAGDLETVALAVDLTAAELRERLEADGILLHLDATGDLVAIDGPTRDEAEASPTAARDGRGHGDLAVTIDLSARHVEPDTRRR